MLVNLKQIIGMAEEGGYCIPAFNVYNIETAMGVTHRLEYIFGESPPTPIYSLSVPCLTTGLRC